MQMSNISARIIFFSSYILMVCCLIKHKQNFTSEFPSTNQNLKQASIYKLKFYVMFVFVCLYLDVFKKL